MTDKPGDYSDVIRGMGEERQREHREFNETLGEPAMFLPDSDDSSFGTGYWRVEGGVVSYRRYVNGYDPYSRMTFADHFIDLLIKVRQS